MSTFGQHELWKCATWVVNRFLFFSPSVAPDLCSLPKKVNAMSRWTSIECTWYFPWIGSPFVWNNQICTYYIHNKHHWCFFWHSNVFFIQARKPKCSRIVLHKPNKVHSSWKGDLEELRLRGCNKADIWKFHETLTISCTIQNGITCCVYIYMYASKNPLPTAFSLGRMEFNGFLETTAQAFLVSKFWIW